MTIQLLTNRTTTGPSGEVDGKGVTMVAPNLRFSGSSAVVRLEGKQAGAWQTVRTFTLPDNGGSHWLRKTYDAYRFNVISITGSVTARLSTVGGGTQGNAGGAVDAYARLLATQAMGVAQQALTLAQEGGGVTSEGPQEQEAPFLITSWPGAVTRVNDTKPLSHQNDSRFTLDPTFTDDFTTFDNAKWYTLPVESGPQALGRIPARYWGNNVKVESGELTIRMHQVNPEQTDWDADDFDPATLMDQPTPYGGYTSGQVISQAYAHYGYFEIKGKIMASAGSSAFWLAYPDVSDPQTEIDVFEMGGKGQTPNPNGDGSYLSSNNRYNMNYHLFESDASPGREGYNREAVWVAPFDFADDYHVYGIDWQEDFVRWYVDGVLIHVKENLDQFYPMKVILDSEAFWGGPSNAETGGWFGFPNNADLPSKFRIDYIRAWTKAI